MSVFTNPATGAAEHAAAYTAALLELLGDREPMVALREMPAALAHAIEGLSPQQLRQRERPGKWSINHILQHLADSELVGSWRMRLILAQATTVGRIRPGLVGGPPAVRGRGSSGRARAVRGASARERPYVGARLCG